MVDADQAAVWDAWTTTAGIASFFAPDGSIELEPGGAYEIYFDPTGSPGHRGAEGTHILALQPMEMLSFTWNFPQQFTELRDQFTTVVLRLAPVDADRTAVALTQMGWGNGEMWDDAYDYFEHAWGEVVLANLTRRFDEGPIEW